MAFNSAGVLTLVGVLISISPTLSENLPNAQCPIKPMENTCAGDSVAFEKTTAPSAIACCALCANFTEKPTICAAFTYRADGNRCFLHPAFKALGPLSPGSCTSGILRPGDIPTPSPPVPNPPVKPYPKDAKNVLFFISDDLRPEFFDGYGQKHMITPNFDKLTSTGMVFNRAYCQQAICGPTRNSFLSGRRPARTQAWNFIDHFREPINGTTGKDYARKEDGRTWISLPGYFKFHNYTTLGAGKTYHPGLPPQDDGDRSWSQDLPYVDEKDKKGCTSDYFSGPSEACPDNGQNLSDFTDYRNLQVSNG